MSHIGRLCGGLLLVSGREVFLVGDLKEPCDFVAAGFEPLGEPIDMAKRRFVRLQPTREVELGASWLVLESDLVGERLAERLAERMLIERNGSVSDRLWRLVTGGLTGAVPARWLVEAPAEVWQMVRDAVLKCS